MYIIAMPQITTLYIIESHSVHKFNTITLLDDSESKGSSNSSVAVGVSVTLILLAIIIIVTTLAVYIFMRRVKSSQWLPQSLRKHDKPSEV